LTEVVGPKIDASLVTQLLAAQFPQWAELEVRPVAVGGWNNKTFHIGDRLLARLPRAAVYSGQIAKEQRWLPRLGPRLPLPIPEPLGMGQPTDGYPWPWSVYRWIDGETAADGHIADERAFATALAEFLNALHRIDAADGPEPGPHNFFRGGPLITYDAQTREAIAALDDRSKAVEAASLWEAALASPWRDRPVWIHGDVAPGNLLVDGGRLSAVIDFGNIGVGDPACDLAIAWTFLRREGREAFRASLPLDSATWARGRGWTLWKALILVTGLVRGHPRDMADAWRVLDEVLVDHRLSV
jgi:aminoglycoside phosphotransferase (APT) family kinase protein